MLEATLENSVVDNRIYLGQEVSYTLKVKNKGTSQAENVKVQIEMPDGIENEKYYLDGYEEKKVESDKMIIDYGNIDVGSVSTKDFTIKYNSTGKTNVYGKILLNNVDLGVKSNTIEDAIQDNDANVEFEINDSSYVDKKEYTVDDEVNVGIVLKNYSKSEINNAKVVLDIPDNVEVTNVFNENEKIEYNFDETTRKLTINFEKLSIHDKKDSTSSTRIYLNVKINDIKEETYIKASAYVGIKKIGEQKLKFNLYDLKYDLQVKTSIDDNTYLKRNDKLNYNISIKNTGEKDIENVWMKIDFAKDTSYIETIKNEEQIHSALIIQMII